VIETLEMEMAIVEGWVRFWFRGELLPLPVELLRQNQPAQSEIECLRAQLRAMGIEPSA
jgi:hypothetical protein